MSMYDVLKTKINILTTNLINQIRNEEPALSEDAVFFDNKTPDEIKNQITKDTIGLSFLSNFPISTDEESLLGTDNNSYLNPKQVKDISTLKIGQVQGLKGQVITIGPTNDFSNLFGKTLLERVDIIDNNEDRTLTLNGPIDKRSVMIDSRNLETRVWNGSSWVTQSSNFYLTHLKRNSFYYNHVTNKLFYTENVDRILYLIKLQT